MKDNVLIRTKDICFPSWFYIDRHLSLTSQNWCMLKCLKKKYVFSFLLLLEIKNKRIQINNSTAHKSQVFLPYHDFVGWRCEHYFLTPNLYNTGPMILRKNSIMIHTRRIRTGQILPLLIPSYKFPRLLPWIPSVLSQISSRVKIECVIIFQIFKF